MAILISNPNPYHCSLPEEPPIVLLISGHIYMSGINKYDKNIMRLYSHKLATSYSHWLCKHSIVWVEFVYTTGVLKCSKCYMKIVHVLLCLIVFNGIINFLN